MASYKEIVGDNVKKTFAKNLQRKMMEYSLNQTELARRMGVTQSTMSDWCHGRVLPRSNRLEQLCKIFHCDPADLLGNVQQAVEYELDRHLSEMLNTPEAKAAEQKIHAQLVEYYQTISQAMAALDETALSRLAAYAEGLMASQEDKNKPPAM